MLLITINYGILVAAAKGRLTSGRNCGLDLRTGERKREKQKKMLYFGSSTCTSVGAVPPRGSGGGAFPVDLQLAGGELGDSSQRMLESSVRGRSAQAQGSSKSSSRLKPWQGKAECSHGHDCSVRGSSTDSRGYLRLTTVARQIAPSFSGTLWTASWP